MGGRKSLAALPIGQTACDVLTGCESRGDRRKYTAVLLAVADYYLFGREPGRSSGVDNDLWSALKGEADRIRREKKEKKDAGGKGGRPTSPEIVSIGKHTKALESIGKHEEADGATAKASGADKIRGEENRTEGSHPSLSSDEPTLQDLEDAFNDLWDAYPRKSGKGDAKRAFFRVVREEGVAPATIFYAVMEQSKSPEWTEDGGKFVPALAKWLDGGRWEDVLSAPPQKNSGAPPAQMIEPPPYDGIDDEAAAMRAIWAAEAAAAKEASSDV